MLSEFSNERPELSDVFLYLMLKMNRFLKKCLPFQEDKFDCSCFLNYLMLYFDTCFYLFIQFFFVHECVPFKAFKRNFGINTGNFLTLNTHTEWQQKVIHI